MPMFEFACRACEHEFEELVRSTSDRDAPACPKCGSRRIERKLSVFAARQASTAEAPRGGGCGRCGDPDGPCGT